MSDASVPGLALLVVDVQATFLRVMPDADRFLRRCHLAVSSAALLGVPVFFTEQVPAKLGPTQPDLLLAAGPKRAVFGKTAFSALAAPGLVEGLRQAGVTHVLVCGLEGSVCVYQTALEALRAEFGVTLLSDAITARRSDDLEVCLTALRAVGAQVLPVETVFYAVLGDATHLRFRAFTDLVKQAG